MSEYIKNRLICAARQFRHNDDNSPDFFSPAQGFVIAYDREEIDALIAELRQQLEQAEARIAELESVGMDLLNDCINFGSGVNMTTSLLEEASECLKRKHSNAWLLRKQAEAVESFACGSGINSSEPAERLISYLQLCAQRLRQQADEMEKNND